MKVSIITVTYNGEQFIEDAITSVINQDYQDIEYIIIDGFSKDGTNEIIQKYIANVDHYISEPDSGIYDAMNKGVQLASGEVVGILNSDDIYFDSGTISRIVAKFQQTGAESVYGNLVYVDSKNTDKVLRYWSAGSYKHGMFYRGWMPPHPSFFISKKAYEAYGLYNSDMKISADYELMLRFLHKHKISTAYLNEVIVKMRAGGVSNDGVRSRLDALREDKLAWKVNKLHCPVYTVYLKKIRKIGQFIFK